MHDYRNESDRAAAALDEAAAVARRAAGAVTLDGDEAERVMTALDKAKAWVARSSRKSLPFALRQEHFGVETAIDLARQTITDKRRATLAAREYASAATDGQGAA